MQKETGKTRMWKGEGRGEGRSWKGLRESGMKGKTKKEEREEGD